MAPRAVGIAKVPPLMFVFAGEVVSVSTWHSMQPILVNSSRPCRALGVCASCASRAGALRAQGLSPKSEVSPKPYCDCRQLRRDSSQERRMHIGRSAHVVRVGTQT